MTTSTPRNLPATEGPAMGPASPHSAASHELREEANVGRLIAAAAVCLPAPDRFGTWENEVPSLVCNASARRRVDGNSSGTAICGWRTGDNAGESRWFEVVHATMFDGDGFAAKSAVSALT